MNVSIEELSFHYPGGVEALRDVDLHISTGEAVAIIGENGAGKSTLAKHMNGLLQADRGSVVIGDWDTRDHTVARLSRRVGYVFQNPDDQLFARSVGSEVAFGPQNLGLEDAELEERVEQALRSVGLERERQKHPYDLHAAKRKLVAIAATLAMETPIIIFDEPTTGQDAHGIALIGTIIERLKDAGRTVLTISHDLDFCAEHFERNVVMSRGRILADGRSEIVLAQAGVLERAGVEAPQMVRLAGSLGLTTTPRTVEEFVQAWMGQRSV